MAKGSKDTAYLALSAELRSLENGLLTREKREQLLAAPSAEETARLLREWGYEGVDPRRPGTWDAFFAAERQALLTELTRSVPNPRLLDVFRLPYDYHNLKTILKADAMGASAEDILSDAGRVKAKVLTKAVREGELSALPRHLAEAVRDGDRILKETGDPQRSDMAIDRRCRQELQEAAEAAGSAFLRNYVRLQTDAANLRALVRGLRMKRDAAFLREALAEGGRVDTESLQSVAEDGGSGLAKQYADTPLAHAAERGEAVLRGGSLTVFEKACDDAEAEFLADARFIPFGEAVAVAYWAARERDRVNLRLILTGKQAGLDADAIRARLREDGR